MNAARLAVWTAIPLAVVGLVIRACYDSPRMPETEDPGAEETASTSKRASERRAGDARNEVASGQGKEETGVEAAYEHTYYPGGEVEWGTPFVNGKEHGLQKKFREDGSVEREVVLRRGKKHGIEKQYYEDGTLMLELPFEDGRMSGVWKEYYRNGRLKHETPFANGFQHGVQRIHDREGNLLHSEEWKHGTGVQKEYDENGFLRKETAYRNGLKHGPMKEYDAKGNIVRKWCYADGWRSLPVERHKRERTARGKRALDEEFNAKKAAWRQRIIDRGECRNAHDALVLLKYGKSLDKVNAFLSGKVRPLRSRSLDIQIYYVILALKDSGLSPEARRHVEGLCNQHYGASLPPYVSIEREFDPWDYQLCGCPTENHLFNDASNRLAETVVFPDRVFSDGRTAAEYRPYWEDAFRKLVSSRITHGMREWRSTIYCHVVFDDAMMVYNIMPEGPTREAARTFLDYLFLSIAMNLRKNLWTGPHSRVYNHGNGCNIIDYTAQCYLGSARCIYGEDFKGPIAISDYAIPEAITRLPFREDRYVSVEKVGPRFHPRGEGEGVFNPAPFNIYIPQSDREDWGGEGIVYCYLTPTYCLGSVQDWGRHDGEWHMHCVPWSFVIASGENTDLVLSFTGSEEEGSQGQGGYMTWGSDMIDQDATIFQHKKTLFSQMRGHFHEKIYEVLWDGFPEAPWAPASGGRHLLGFRGERKHFHTRFYVADSIGQPVVENGWVFGEKAGVCFAIRSVRGGFREEKQRAWVRGRVYACDIRDDVILIEVGEMADCGSFESFRRRILETPLSWDDRSVRFTNLDGDRIVFAWKEDADPTVNGSVPEYSGMRFNDPCVRSELDSGVIEVECGAVRTVLVAEP